MVESWSVVRENPMEAAGQQQQQPPWMEAVRGLSLEQRSLVTTPTKLACYDGLGKKKNDRIFSVDLQMYPPIVTWKIKATSKKGKSMALRDVHDGTRIPTARQIFQHMDADGNGQLDEQEVAEVHRVTMGKKLVRNPLNETLHLAARHIFTMYIDLFTGAGQVEPEGGDAHHGP